MDTLGVVETMTIAGGVALADAMVKVASVELVKASTICSGRYIIFVAGDRQAVGTSVAHAVESGRRIIGSYVISNISPLVTAALKKISLPAAGDALGLVECRDVASGINAADHAVKRSAVNLLRLVTGSGIRGKSYFVLGGDVASVREAVEALGDNLVETTVIPRPDAAVFNALTGVR